MAQNGYGPAPVAGHIGRIPNFGKSQPMGMVEPPACIQNAMMTKDKKPFTYTPGGLDLSQIRTPSMARRLARQRSNEEEPPNTFRQANGGPNYHPQGGSIPPPPPPPQVPAPAPPPPPPSLLIEVPKSKSPKPMIPGERPEIVIPENPIGMLRKTNSPYHWEAEKAELDKIGPVPKFMEKVPSPLTVKMPPSTFSQQPPQSYTPQAQSNIRQNHSYRNQTPESPIHRPEAQYGHQKSNSPNTNASPPTREFLQRQDSQFNKSPQPFTGQTQTVSGSPFSPSPNNNWKQPERRDSPASNINNSSQTSPFNRSPLTPNTQHSPSYLGQFNSANTDSGFHTLPRVNQRTQDNQNNIQNNVIYNNTRDVRPQNPNVDSSNTTPWRTATLNGSSEEGENQNGCYKNNTTNQQVYSPPWKTNESSNGRTNESSSWKPDNNKPDPQYIPPWVRSTQEANNNKANENFCAWNPQSKNSTNFGNSQNSPSPPRNQYQGQPHYQSTMSIPVTPRTPTTQQNPNNEPVHKEAVYVNQEPVYYCPESPKSIPPWVKTQKEKTKTPPPVWCQRPLEGRRSAPRELTTPPKDLTSEPEWVKKSNAMQRGAREIVSPPKYQQPVQPAWSTRPSDNRNIESIPYGSGNRVVPIQMDIDSTDQGRQGQPQLRLVIDMNPNGNNQSYSQPTQRIMRVLSPQLVRLDDASSQPDLPSLNRNIPSQDNQPKTRIIPIQIEGDSNGSGNKSFGGRY